MSCGFNASTSKFQSPNTAMGFTTSSSTNFISFLIWAFAKSNGQGATEFFGTAMMIAANVRRPAMYYSSTSGVMRITQGFSTTNGIWSFPAPLNQWNAIAMMFDRGTPATPRVFVNFVPVTVTVVQAPSGTHSSGTTASYCVGNISSLGQSWDGWLQYAQVFTSYLSDAEAFKGLMEPGTVDRGLIHYARMRDPSDVVDAVDGAVCTATDLTLGPHPPIAEPYDLAADSGLWVPSGWGALLGQQRNRLVR